MHLVICCMLSIMVGFLPAIQSMAPTELTRESLLSATYCIDCTNNTTEMLLVTLHAHYLQSEFLRPGFVTCIIQPQKTVTLQLPYFHSENVQWVYDTNASLWDALDLQEKPIALFIVSKLEIFSSHTLQARSTTSHGTRLVIKPPLTTTYEITGNASSGYIVYAEHQVENSEEKHSTDSEELFSSSPETITTEEITSL